MHFMHYGGMNLIKLRHAIFLADWGNFTAAAARLNLSQPALSRSIQSLEDELGLLLFERMATGVVPTTAGASIIEDARGLLSQADGLMARAGRLARGETGRVRIGVGPMFAGLLTDYLRGVWQPAQAVEVEIHILPGEALVNRLLADELDFFVADGSTARHHAGIAIEHIGHVPVQYHVRKGHPLGDRHAIAIEDMVIYPRASPKLPSVPVDPGGAVNESVRVESGRIYCEQLQTLVDLTHCSDAILLAITPAIGSHINSGDLVTLDIPALSDWNAQIVLARRAGLTPAPTVERYASAMVEHVQLNWMGVSNSA